MKQRVGIGLAALAVALGVVPAAQAAPAARATAPGGRPTSGGVEVSSAAHQDVSGPLRNVPPEADSGRPQHEHPLNPGHGGGGGGGGGNGGGSGDPVRQTSQGSALNLTVGPSFAGVGNGDYGFSPDAAPPDTEGAVGATQYVQWVNESFAVFDKSTHSLTYGPTLGNSLWRGFGGGCETNNDGDPIVQYDKVANRWVFTQFSIATSPYLMCVAVSQTSDATGAYNRYSFNYGNQFPDYPKLGVWPDAYYVSSNIFTNGSSWAGAKACAWNRTSMLSGGNGVQVCFQLSTAYGSLLPADLDGPASPPPSGAPGYFVDLGSSALNLWTFHADWATPANSTLTGPTSLPAAAFQQACNGGTCVPQSGTRQKLDSLGDRLMYRFAYRNLTSTLGHESLVVNQSVNPGDGTSGVRWYELQKTGSGAWTVAQQSTFAPTDSKYRWMGSVAMDKRGDLAVGYSESNSSMFPAVVVNGRPAGSSTLGAEVVVKAGGGSQLPSLSRWGDYSAMTIDPVDDCTFWYTNEYLKTSGTFNWSTWITAFRFPGCT